MLDIDFMQTYNSRNVLTRIGTMLVVEVAQLLVVLRQPNVFRQRIRALRGCLEYQPELLQLDDDGATRSRTIDQIVVYPVDNVCAMLDDNSIRIRL